MAFAASLPETGAKRKVKVRNGKRETESSSVGSGSACGSATLGQDLSLGCDTSYEGTWVKGQGEKGGRRM